jgi:hypothetical protein
VMRTLGMSCSIDESGSAKDGFHDQDYLWLAILTSLAIVLL